MSKSGQSGHGEWPGIGVDDYGSYSVVDIDLSIYGEEAIFKTAYWLTDRFFLFLRRRGPGRLIVEFRAKPPTASTPAADLATAVGEFCNGLIDFKVRQQVIQETGTIRETLVSKAFSEGIPTPGLQGASSNERSLPTAADDYHSDPVGAGRR